MLTTGWANQCTDSCCLIASLAFEACSARPASKVLRCTLAGYSGLVVRRLSRGKYIILSESRAQRALNGTCFS